MTSTTQTQLCCDGSGIVEDHWRFMSPSRRSGCVNPAFTCTAKWVSPQFICWPMKVNAGKCETIYLTCKDYGPVLREVLVIQLRETTSKSTRDGADQTAGSSLARRLLCLLIHFFIALHRSSPHIIKLFLYTLILSKTLRLFGHCYDGILTLGDYIKAQARHLINSANSSEWDRIRARSSREGPGPLHKLRRTRALLVNPPYTPMYSQSYCLCLS
ncbi:hypothetical protein J6590_098604 [Homalodisca vitripennis]|nr:hypothetical protein J6590_098604 [Homalodisca vitripennis]